MSISRTFNSSNPLFICDLANNHFGDVNHAIKIIDELAEVAVATKEMISVKFQFRNLDSYIHREFRDRRDIKYIDRFLSTRLQKEQFHQLAKHIHKSNLISMATPFDEESVDWCAELGIEIIKIASASSNDYPLIEKIASAGKPVVASTAGLKIEEIDNLIFRLVDKVPRLTIMHCVAIYPCEEELLNLNQIALIQKRFPQIGIGFSTHERPENMLPVTIASSLGAVALERHVGIKSPRYSLNDYSAQPSQIKLWIESSKRTRSALGPQSRPPSTQVERETLSDLKRGLYAKRDLDVGELIDVSNSYFAFPLQWKENQFHAGNIEDGLVVTSRIQMHSPINSKNAFADGGKEMQRLASIILQTRGMLANAGVSINPEATIEVSHHYGLARFREFGAVLITCLNEEYAKKLVIQLPRQKHPYHYHKAKQETFQLLWGDMELTIEGYKYNLKPGELYTVRRGQWHKFHTLHGAIVEEISSTAISGDSFYEDDEISKLEVEKRKTKIKNWVSS